MWLVRAGMIPAISYYSLVWSKFLIFLHLCLQRASSLGEKQKWHTLTIKQQKDATKTKLVVSHKHIR